MKREIKMNFNLIRYYDTCCDQCGNWATSMYHPNDLGANKTQASNFLSKRGWSHKKEKVICENCNRGLIQHGDNWIKKGELK